MPQFQSPSAFGRELRAAGGALLQRQPTGRYANRSQWLVGIGYLSGFVGVYAWLLAREPDGWSFLLAALAGFFAYAVVASFCHDASHGSLSRRRSVNRIALFLGFAVVGVSGALWGRRHVREHHMFPNVDGTDIDADSTLLVRLTPHRPWRPWHRFQIYYAPILYLTVLWHLAFVEDWKHLREARMEKPARYRTWAASLEFAAAKLLHLGLGLGLPLLLIDASFWSIVAAYAIASAATSAMFVMINIGTHVCDGAAFVKPDESGVIGHDWATHQAMTAVDWAPQNRLAVALTGGANAHAAHHLFPEAAHCHNARLTKLVDSFAAKHDAPRLVTSFAGMLAAHARHLIALGRRPTGGAEAASR
ncbi:MAG: fatty acid desaturase [Neomegalonema sp.]|nr:fatty acid desaturase [Neomegalonema sp.]